ncbi:MAG: Gfo/Idh/MocA family protein [Bacteroidales bacterium]
MIRIGIICPSEIAFRRFLPSLQKTYEFEYVGVAIANMEEFVGATDEILAKERQKAQTFVGSYGGKIFEGYGQLIRSTEVDAIYLPLPPAIHYKWGKKALEQGKHVLLEKPSTTSLADTQALVSLALEKGLALHENYMFVFHNQIAAIKEIIRSGEIGDVRLYRISFGFPRRTQNDFRYNKNLGGGALLDAGGYTIKLATELLGNDVKLTSAATGYLDEFEVDMFGAATLQNKRGLVAQVAFGMDNDYKCDLEIWGSKGTLTTGRILTAPNGFTPTYTIKKNQDYIDGILPADDAFLKSIERFGSCIRNNSVRLDNYEMLLRHQRLVEEFMNLSEMN